MRRLTTGILALCAILAAPVAPATAQVTRITNFVTCGGTINTGGTAQQAIAAHDMRNVLIVQNPIGAAGPLYVDFGTTATATGNSIELAPGGSINFLGSAVPTQYVSVLSATTGARFICKAGRAD